MIWQSLLGLAVLLAACYVLTLAMLSLLSRRPAGLGVVAGQLRPCPGSPNCVSTLATDKRQRIEPLTYSGGADEAMRLLRATLAALPRTRVITATGEYLHVECTSRFFRFTDDVEFLIDDEHKTIHFRSASRVGLSDLGVNRRRMETIRRGFSCS